MNSFFDRGSGKPEGAARPYSRSCTVRFAICHFKAASLCETSFRSLRLAVAVEGTGCEPLALNPIGERLGKPSLEMLYVNHV